MKILLTMAATVLSGWLGTSALASGAPASCPADTPAKAVIDAASVQGRFGQVLYGKLQSAEPGATVLVSPMSVATALELIGTGAEGATRDQFETALQLAPLKLDEVAAQQPALRRALTPCADTRFETANSIWTALGLELKSAFVKREGARFDAEIRSVDFAKPKTLGTINGWIANKTNGKIAKMLSSLPPAVRLVLVNALHFKGTWFKPFDKSDTTALDFHLAGGSTARVPGMHKTAHMRYLESPLYKAVALPFADTRYEMVVILPHADEPTWKKLDPSNYAPASFASAKVRLTLPRMHLSWDGELSGALKAMGLTEAFGNGARFGGLTASPIKVDQVLHKVVFDADEQGAEGAAATVIMGVMGAAPHPEPTFEMTVDRPYYLIVRETSTGAVLFMGYVADPGTRQ